MRQVCCVCKKLFGIKEPFDDDSETHGICEVCFPLEMKKIDEEVKKLNNGGVSGRLE